MKRKMRGEGWDRHEILTPENSEEMEKALTSRFDNWNNDLLEGGGSFGAVTHNAHTWSKETLRDIPMVEGLPAPKEGSPHDYTLKIKKYVEVVQAELKRGDADCAARFAWEAGRLFERVLLKFQFEDDTIWVRERRKNLAERRDVYNKAISNLTKERNQRWQAYADEIWASNQLFSVSNVAQLIRSKHSIEEAVRTIRREIKKVGQAS